MSVTQAWSVGLRIAKELKVILQYIHTSNMMDTIILQTRIDRYPLFQICNLEIVLNLSILLCCVAKQHCL